MSGRLRIGIVTPGWAGPSGDVALPAIEEHVRRIAQVHEVAIVTLRHPMLRGRYAWHGMAVHPLGGGTRAGVMGRGALLARAVRTLVTLHRETPFDVLHGLWADESGAVAVAAGRLVGRPVLVSVLGGELVGLVDIGYGAALGLGGRWTVDAALRGASLVTVGSGPLLRSVTERAPGTRVILAPLGVDLAAFPAEGREGGGGARLLFVGSLSSVKDPVTALRAFARLAADHPIATLEMVGDGPLRDGLERLAGSLGIAARVRFAGAVSRSELAGRYRTADVLVISSRHEAQSMVACEAAASGLPVVGTAVGAVVDLERDGGAVCVPVGSPVALASALRELLGDAERRLEMGRAGRESAERSYGLDAAWQGFAAMYGRLVGGS